MPSRVSWLPGMTKTGTASGANSARKEMCFHAEIPLVAPLGLIRLGARRRDHLSDRRRGHPLGSGIALQLVGDEHARGSTLLFEERAEQAVGPPCRAGSGREHQERSRPG